MAQRDRLPVILGSGLTGLMISRSLSRKGVPHVLIGGPPGPEARLGESLNLEGTLGVLELCPDLLPHCTSKRFASADFGDHFFSCEFDFRQSGLTKIFFRLLGHAVPTELLHIERIRFDAALYESAVAAPQCTVVDARVAEMEYDPGSDRVETLELSDGTRLRPSSLFDATNHARLVPKRLNLGVRLLGETQRVVFTHYHLPPGADAPAAESDWMTTTHGARLYRELDGVDALTWCIPLQGYVSVGISLEAGTNDLPDEALLEIAKEAFARRGIRYRETFSETSAVKALNFRNFIHDRAYGENWLLAGPTFCQVWWMAGAGVGSSFTAAQIAPQFLHSPQKVGRLYQNYLSTLLVTHDSFDWMTSIRRDQLSIELIRDRTDSFIRSNLFRLLKLAPLRSGATARLVAKLLSLPCRWECFTKDYCLVKETSVAEQVAPVNAAWLPLSPERT